MAPPEAWHLMVVDDDPLVRELLETRLSAKGYHVTSANDGEQAYAALKTVTPHLIVCDVVMPGLDGLGLCKRLRSEGNTIPFLFLTAKGQPRDIIEVLESGADDYVVKPFDAAELVLRINAVLRRFYPAPKAP